MDKTLETIVQDLQKKFEATFEEFRGEAHVFVQPAQIVDVLTYLRVFPAFCYDGCGLLAAARAAFPCHLSIDIGNEEPVDSGARSGQGDQPCGPDRERDF